MKKKIKKRIKQTLVILFIIILSPVAFTQETLKNPDMVRIPEGTLLGCGNNKIYIYEFWMDRHEVTNREYKKCVDAGICRPPVKSESYTRPDYYGNSRYDNFPVIYVSWRDAKRYCEWNGKRLPTEAEWEYASRGSLVGARYPNGNSISCDDANFARWKPDKKCWNYNKSDNDTHPAGIYPSNGYGLHDMAGNVWEWVSDWYEKGDKPGGSIKKLMRISKGKLHTIRGGSWRSGVHNCALNIITGFSTKLRFADIGFRCAK
jgi:formylglycine-generating enzyme required for sulfatase activity